MMTVAHHDFSAKLNTHAFFKTSDREASQDLVQDTFVKTWSYLVKGGKITVMKAFLYHVLNNLIIDGYRKHKTTSLDTMVENGFEPNTDTTERLMNTLDGGSAMLLISRIPLKYQKVMRMRYVQDLSLMEMSLITGMTKNTMAVQLHRGMEKLKLLYAAKP